MIIKVEYEDSDNIYTFDIIKLAKEMKIPEETIRAAVLRILNRE